MPISLHSKQSPVEGINIGNVLVKVFWYEQSGYVATAFYKFQDLYCTQVVLALIRPKPKIKMFRS